MDKPFAAYQGDEPYIFVCYAHDDAAVVYPELARLRDAGVNVWYDEGIPAGSNWRAHLGGALDGAAQVLFYASKASLASDHCDREINYALDEGKQIVPVLLDDTPLPADLKMGLSRVQMIHKSELSREAYERTLAQALSAGRGSQDGAGQHSEVTQAALTSPAQPDPAEARTGRSRWIAIAAVVVALVGGFTVYEMRHAPSNPEESATALKEITQTPAAKRSIAVLPFVNMSSDPEQEYFSDGISEEVLNLLAKNPELKVISRSSSFTFKGKEVDIRTVAGQLGVAHVLEGSVRKSGNKVRITAQLIDAETDTHLWSHTFDRELTDIFAIQDEIAAKVVEALNVTLFGVPESKPVPNLDAYALYLQGRHVAQTFGTAEELAHAEALLKQALALDPDYADAWIALAGVYGSMRFIGEMSREQAQPLIRDAIERARAIDPENAGIYIQLATDAVREERDLASAARYVERGLALDPTNLSMIQAAGGMALNLGRLTDAEALAEYVAARDPLCADCSFGLSLVYLLQDRLDEAAAAYQTSELVGIGGGGGRNMIPAFLLLLQGKYEESLARWALANPGMQRTYGETITLYSMGRAEEFAARFQAFEDQYGAEYPTYMARIYAWMDDVDSAFEWLDRYSPGQPELGQVIDNYWEFQSLEFRPLHDDPRWHAYLQRLGVAPEQLAAIEFNIPLPAQR